jgi:hypothetical protein
MNFCLYAHQNGSIYYYIIIKHVYSYIILRVTINTFSEKCSSSGIYDVEEELLTGPSLDSKPIIIISFKMRMGIVMWGFHHIQNLFGDRKTLRTHERSLKSSFYSVSLN